jgi:hypothetical protein
MAPFNKPKRSPQCHLIPATSSVCLATAASFFPRLQTTVYTYLQAWEAMNSILREQLRLNIGRNRQPLVWLSIGENR